MNRVWLFERIQCAPVEFIEPFSVLFYKQYGQSRICHNSVDAFRDYVEVKFYLLWEDKYSRLFNSRNTVNNPFQTTFIQRGESTQGHKKNLVVGDYRGSGAHNQSGTQEGSDKGATQNDEAVKNSKTTREDGTTWGSKHQVDSKEGSTTGQETNIDTETPQDPQQLGGYTPSTSGEVPNELNNGYATKATMNSNAERLGENQDHGEDNISEYDNKSGEVGYGQTAQLGKTWGRSEQRNREAGQTVSHSTNIQNSGTLAREKSALTRYGYENQSAVSLLEEWRKSFAPFTQMFMNEFQPCFWVIIEDI